MFVSLILLLTTAWITVAQQKIPIDLNYSILEEVPVKTHIGDVARDSGLITKHGQQNAAKLRYRILQKSDFKDHFAITQKGILMNSKLLDREVLCPGQDICQIELDIVAMANQIFERLRIKIEVSDKNDNSPTFSPSQQTIEIPESSDVNSTFLVRAAVDKDSTPNGVKLYRLKSESPVFALKATRTITGDLEPTLVLLQSLDHEVQTEYQLEVECLDGGNQAGSLALTVKVLDDNDNCPIFKQSEYMRTIRENVARGFEVVTLQATDMDGGDNGRITYSFNRKTTDLAKSTFRLNPISGKITVRNFLDYDKASSYIMIVEATDSGLKPCTATATVTVTLEDVNDESPIIEIDSLSDSPFMQVLEHSPAGTFVEGHISVTDSDSGPAGVVQCELLNNIDFVLVSIGDGEYRLKTAREFDREVNSVYRVTIQCKDQGKQPLVTTETFQIKISDRNDRSPQFVKKHYTAQVKENRDTPEYVTTVRAIDGDLGDNGKVAYSIQGAFANHHFRITNDSGIITIKRPLDRERNASVIFKVMAKDHGKPSNNGTATVTVKIVDENDNPPLFDEESYAFTVYEEQAPPIEIGKVSARDLDATAIDPVKLHLDENVPDSDKFMLTSDGRILSKVKLNREERAFYNLRIIGTDGTRPAPPKSTVAAVLIQVLDVNDNEPEIHYPGTYNNSLYISYLQPAGAEIATIDATDRDSGRNAKLQFEFWEPSTNNPGLFVLNVDTGSISLARKLDSKDIGKYRLAIFVKDSGVRSHTKVTDLTVFISEPVEVPGYPRAGQHNLIIVVILACVSAAVTVVIIMLIIFIRSKDRQTHRYNARREEEKKDTMMRNVEVLDCDTYKQIRINGKPEVGRKTDNGGYSLSPASKETDMDSTGSHSASSTLLAPAGTDGPYQVPRRALYTVTDPRYVPVHQVQGYQQSPHYHHNSSTLPREMPRTNEYSTGTAKSSGDVQKYATVLREIDVDKASVCDSGKGASDEDLRTLREREQRPRSGYHGNYAMQTFSPRVPGSRLLATVPPRQASPASSLPSSSNETVIHVVDKTSDSNLSAKLSDPRLNDTKISNVSSKESSFDDGSMV